ncbi:hypothetical protein TNCT_221981 [Trichonephila clavata]|uniref:Uncharacterized protein n=1 Tax=Trichonephila clavata TaxID=2740835 RepID=A0A8X6G1P3_TRICU|nr:hypothetical protein TNCT_221981 [Trichonephila clavata]
MRVWRIEPARPMNSKPRPLVHGFDPAHLPPARDRPRSGIPAGCSCGLVPHAPGRGRPHHCRSRSHQTP